MVYGSETENCWAVAKSFFEKPVAISPNLWTHRGLSYLIFFLEAMPSENWMSSINRYCFKTKPGPSENCPMTNFGPGWLRGDNTPQIGPRDNFSTWQLPGGVSIAVRKKLSEDIFLTKIIGFGRTALGGGAKEGRGVRMGAVGEASGGGRWGWGRALVATSPRRCELTTSVGPGTLTILRGGTFSQIRILISSHPNPDTGGC